MVKRAMDIGFALLLLIATLPLQILVAALVAIDLGRPVFFFQLRAGRNGSIFRLFKFRSMRPARVDLPAEADERRVTRLGRLIRRFRFDELPQILLILVGHMSLVGPRPLYPSGHAADNSPLFHYRHRVRPGLTGWAQVNGNTLLSEREKFSLDSVYVSRVSPMFDLWILCKTVVTVLVGEKRHEANIERALNFADRLDRNG